MKNRLLCILHRSPPAHGAAKVGDFIAESEMLKEAFKCEFITIKSSNTIGDIGKVNFKKFYLVLELYIKILWFLLSFRPNKIYFTASVSGVAFYRDIFLSTLWKLYRFFINTDIFYHYHTKGIDKFVSGSHMRLILTNFFLKDINVILLSPLLEKDLIKISTYKKIFFLPNGVEDIFFKEDFNLYLQKKFDSLNTHINILYLSNMIKSKGYFEVLELAREIKNEHICFNFAGSWQNETDKNEFFEYIQKNKLEEIIVFHGFLSGKEKKELFKKSHIFIFPTRYKNEAFPLSVLEALSYGIPVITTNEGSIAFIIDKYSGIVLEDVSSLCSVFKKEYKKYINIGTATYCRNRYMENFSLKKFENNLIKILI